MEFWGLIILLCLFSIITFILTLPFRSFPPKENESEGDENSENNDAIFGPILIIFGLLVWLGVMWLLWTFEIGIIGDLKS